MPLLHRALVMSILALASAGHASAASLSPVAGDRVASNAAVIASAIDDAITDGETDAAENLRHVLDTNEAFRVYHRDRQVLVAMNTRRNLFVGDKRSAERQAADVVRGVLQERFGHLFETEAGFPGLDPSAVRVVFVEPDAFDDCPGRRPIQRGEGAAVGNGPVPFGSSGFWSNGWATPAPCTSCR